MYAFSSLFRYLNDFNDFLYLLDQTKTKRRKEKNYFVIFWLFLFSFFSSTFLRDFSLWLDRLSGDGASYTWRDSTEVERLLHNLCFFCQDQGSKPAIEFEKIKSIYLFLHRNKWIIVFTNGEISSELKSLQVVYLGGTY